jgi:hypothetical protein
MPAAPATSPRLYAGITRKLLPTGERGGTLTRTSLGRSVGRHDGSVTLQVGDDTVSVNASPSSASRLECLTPSEIMAGSGTSDRRSSWDRRTCSYSYFVTERQPGPSFLELDSVSLAAIHDEVRARDVTGGGTRQEGNGFGHLVRPPEPPHGAPGKRVRE